MKSQKNNNKSIIKNKKIKEPRIIKQKFPEISNKKFYVQSRNRNRKKFEGREEKQHVIMTSASLCYAFLPCGQTNEKK
jgi:hypothetical protein